MKTSNVTVLASKLVMVDISAFQAGHCQVAVIAHNLHALQSATTIHGYVPCNKPHTLSSHQSLKCQGNVKLLSKANQHHSHHGQLPLHKDARQQIRVLTKHITPGPDTSQFPCDRYARDVTYQLYDIMQASMESR